LLDFSPCDAVPQCSKPQAALVLGFGLLGLLQAKGKMMLRKMQKVWSRVLLGYPKTPLLGTIPGAILGTLVCWSSTAMEAQAGFINLEVVPIGTALGDGVAVFQHTNNKHKNPDAFLTTQDDQKKPNDDGFVAAFNGASANAGNPEAIFSGGKTHTIVLGDIPVTSDNAFRVFLFDANQNQSELDDHIDITMLQVFTSASASLTSIADLTTANLIYDLDNPTLTNPVDGKVRIDGSVGTGGADMYFFVPNGLFGSNEAINVYLYYQYTNFNDGTEAWTLDKNSTYVNPTGGEVPEPTTMALWTLGGSLALLRRSRRKR
jgi:hypothetical protein